MNEKERAKYRELLLRMREEILRTMNHLEKESLGTSPREAAGDLSGYPIHMADVGGDNYIRDVELDMVTRSSLILKEIEEALKRLEDGDFGKCEVCGDTIPKARLEVVPYARLCVRCKEEKEKREKGLV